MVSMQSRSQQHLRDTKQNASFEASIIVPDQQLLHPTNGDCASETNNETNTVETKIAPGGDLLDCITVRCRLLEPT